MTPRDSGRWLVPAAALVATALSAALLAALLTAPMAQAGYDPVASGRTTLRLAPGFVRLLHRHHVKLEGRGGATVHGRAVRFPVTGGKLEPVESRGAVEHGGRLVFRAGRRKLPLRALQLKTTRARSPLAAKLGGGKLKLSEGGSLRETRRGFGTSFRVTGIRLSAKVATRLDKKLGLRGVFRAGQKFGSTATAVEAATVGLAPAGRIELTLDPAFAAKLASFFVAVNPIFPGEHPGPFTFPIGGGVLAPDGSTGTVKSTGGVEFIQVGGGQFFVRNPEPETASATVDAEYQLVLASSGPGPNQAGPLLGLGPGAFSSEPAARAITEAGAPVTLGSIIAQAFNEAFARPLGRPDSFAAGEVLGTIAYTATGE